MGGLCIGHICGVNMELASDSHYARSPPSVPFKTDFKKEEFSKESLCGGSPQWVLVEEGFFFAI